MSGKKENSEIETIDIENSSIEMSDTESFKDFVKRFTLVPNSFVDDFYMVLPQDDKYDPKAFMISFDVVVKWLDGQKFHFKRMLTNNFTRDVDYTIYYDDMFDDGRNRRRESIYMTVDCFKRFCMLSRTEKGEQTRQYFLEMEDSLRRYHLVIRKELEFQLEEFRNRIKQLELNQKGNINKTTIGGIYFFKALNVKEPIDIEDDEEVLKIGYVSNDLNSRFNTYNPGLGDRLIPDFFLPCDDPEKIEACVKSMIKDKIYRKNKEIYILNTDMLKYLISNCINLRKGMKSFKESNLYIKEIIDNGDDAFLHIVYGEKPKIEETGTKNNNRINKGNGIRNIQTNNNKKVNNNNNKGKSKKKSNISGGSYDNQFDDLEFIGNNRFINSNNLIFMTPDSLSNLLENRKRF